MGFENRLDAGIEWEIEISRWLKRLGFLINKYGQGAGINPEFYEFHDAIRFMNDNPTARFVRYLPDWIIAIKDKCCYLVDAKTTIRTDTDNYSYELASYDIGMKLHDIGVDVIAIFPEWRADFIYNLKFIKRFESPIELSGVKGSKTPFGLIKKETVPSFADFFGNILKTINKE